jgi:hypothetical protein
VTRHSNVEMAIIAWDDAPPVEAALLIAAAKGGKSNY